MRLALFSAALLLLAGCEGWPLYLNLPPPEVPVVEPAVLSFAEDAGLVPGDVQDLGDVAVPSQVTITGSVDSCGYDVDAAGPEWPAVPLDTDGDGLQDLVAPRNQGWFTDDVDLFGFDVSTGGWLEARLEWDNSPDDENSPVDSADPDGPWSTESDLDLIVLAWEGIEAGPVLNDQGVSLAHPEQSAQLLRFEPGDALAVGVACHHGLASTYRLRLDLILP